MGRLGPRFIQASYPALPRSRTKSKESPEPDSLVHLPCLQGTVPESQALSLLVGSAKGRGGVGSGARGTPSTRLCHSGPIGHSVGLP